MADDDRRLTVPATVQTPSQSSASCRLFVRDKKETKWPGSLQNKKPGEKPDASAWAGMGASLMKTKSEL
jgi:hypothetical protein